MMELPEWAKPLGEALDARRKAGEKVGTLRAKPSGSVEWRFYIGPRQVSAYGSTLKDLKDDHARKQARYQAAPTTMRLNQLLDAYIEHKRDVLRHDSRQVKMLTQKFEDYIRPKLGRYLLGDLCQKRSLIGNVFMGFSKTHPNSRTIQITFDELKRAFRYGMAQDWCNSNPCEVLPRPKYESSEPYIFSVEEIMRLLDLAQGQDRMLILTMVLTASRPGEIWGIKRRDVDLEKGVLNICAFVNTDENGRRCEKSTGKVRRARRKVPIVDSLGRALHFYFAARDLKPEDYIFGNQQGGLINDTNWRRHHFDPLIKKMNLEKKATPYDLRHSSNTFMVELGVPDEIRAAILGHSKEVNRKVYSHPRLEAQRAGLSKVDALFAGLLGQGSDGQQGLDKGQKIERSAA